MGGALVREPKVFLFDDRCRISTPRCARRCASRSSASTSGSAPTIIYVTHDQVEAMTLADKIVVMNGGHIEQVGDPPDAVPAAGEPLRRRLHRLAENELLSGETLADETACMPTSATASEIEMPGSARRHIGPYAGRDVEIGIRPEHLLDGESDQLRRHRHGRHHRRGRTPGLTSLITFVLGGTSYTAIGDIAADAPARRAGAAQGGGEDIYLIDPETAGWFIPADTIQPLSASRSNQGNTSRCFIDHRTYTFQPLKMGKWLALYEEYALPVQLEISRQSDRLLSDRDRHAQSGGASLGLSDLNDRARRRAEMARIRPGTISCARTRNSRRCCTRNPRSSFPSSSRRCNKAA